VKIYVMSIDPGFIISCRPNINDESVFEGVGVIVGVMVGVTGIVGVKDGIGSGGKL
jgi:hypothetical protein